MPIMKNFTHTRFLLLLAAALLGPGLLPSPAADGKPEGARDLTTLVTNQRLKQLTTTLMLSDEQKEKVRPLLAEEVKYFHGLNEDAALDEAAKTEKQKSYRESIKPKYKAILTEEQYAKWEQSLTPKKRKKPAA